MAMPEWFEDMSVVEVAADLANKSIGKSRFELAKDLQRSPKELVGILDRLISQEYVGEQHGYYYPTKRLLELRYDLPKPTRIKGWKGLLLGRRNSYRPGKYATSTSDPSRRGPQQPGSRDAPATEGTEEPLIS